MVNWRGSHMSTVRKSVVYLLFPVFLLWLGTLPGHSAAVSRLGNPEVAKPISEQESVEVIEQGLANSLTKPVPRFKAQSMQAKLRDPFVPSNLGIGRQQRHRALSRFDGLIYDDEKPSAIVRGKMVSPGDRILGMRVIKIQGDKVVLANQKNVRIFYLF